MSLTNKQRIDRFTDAARTTYKKLEEKHPTIRFSFTPNGSAELSIYSKEVAKRTHVGFLHPNGEYVPRYYVPAKTRAGSLTPRAKETYDSLQSLYPTTLTLVSFRNGSFSLQIVNRETNDMIYLGMLYPNGRFVPRRSRERKAESCALNQVLRAEKPNT